MNTMTRRERLEATMAGQVTDRPPMSLWRHFPGDDRRPEDLAASQLAFQQLYDFDVMKVSPTSSFQVQDWGVEDQYEGNTEGTYVQTAWPLAHSDEWFRLPVLDPAEGALARQLRCLELLTAHLVDRPDPVPFIQTVFSPLAQAKKLVPPGEMLITMRREPEALEAGLETITRSTIAFVEAAKQTGIAGIYYAVQFASYGTMSEEEYREFGEPYDRRILEHLDGTWFNVLHIHGRDVMFDLMADYPVQAINWHDQETAPSLAEALERTQKVLIGGLDQQTMMTGTPEDVREKAAQAIAATAGIRFMLGVGCVTMVASPWGNIRAAREAVEGGV
jgi:uroporphyrinogen decarboxylase